MAPTPAAISSLLRQAIHYHLDNSAYENALFFSERLSAQDPRSSEAVRLHALSHLQLRDFRSAYDVAKTTAYRGTHVGCAWVFAQACLALERYKDGITALEKSRSTWITENNLGKHSAQTRAATPDAAAVLCLLGKLQRGYGDKKRAISCFEEALKMSPLMWDAFTALCDMGINVRVPNIFRAGEPLLSSLDPTLSQTHNKENGLSEAPAKKSSSRPAVTDLGADPFNVIATDSNGPAIDMFVEPAETDFMSKIQAARARLASSTNSQPTPDGMETPTNGSTSDIVPPRQVNPQEEPQAPPRRIRNTAAVYPSVEPPRMNYRLGGKRTGRALDRGNDETTGHMAEAANPPPVQPTRSAIPAAERKRTVSGHPVTRPVANADEHATRRSARLNMFKPSVKANSGAATIGASAGRELKKARPQISRIVRPGSSGSNVGRVVSGNRKPLEDQNGVDVDHGETARVREAPSHLAQAKSAEPDAVKLEEALRWTLDLMKKLGSGYYHLSRFQCPEALQAFASLSSAHQNTPWVLAQIGRAHYEQAAYADAEKYFRKMRVQAPSRLQDMEVYSTVLWHLKRETDLAFLAHELVDSAWHSPQAWCAVGNAWSLARDPDQALKCFKRATQLDPKFAYAFTLQGHEHVASEEYDKALTAYRAAIAADRRHYNAYYGIGRVQERLGSYEKAHTHFQAAQSINPNNPVLICCIGTVLEKLKQIMPALQAYTRAAELAPRAPQTRYKKARGLLAVGQVEAAQNELMILKDLAPDDGMVHFLLGTLYRSMNEKQLAVRHFTIALALDPKVCCHMSLTYMESETDSTL